MNINMVFCKSSMVDNLSTNTLAYLCTDPFHAGHEILHLATLVSWFSLILLKR
jgi:hypothetical protein